MRFSSSGQRFRQSTGILELMEDLDLALGSPGGPLLLGGGNPGRVPEVELEAARILGEIAADAERASAVFGVYDHPQGDVAFREDLAEYLGPLVGRSLTRENITITNGSQSAFFGLFTLFGGRDETGHTRPLVLPLLPEYVGYADIPEAPDFFRGIPGTIRSTGPHRFKYAVDFEALRAVEDPAAVCVSRPANPSGNVLSDEEVVALGEFAAGHDVPLLIDSAYGLPFPGLVYTDATLQCPASAVLVLSLSKLGLPGVRTGIVVGPPEVAAALGRWNAVAALSVGSVGPAIGRALLKEGRLRQLTEGVLRPYYLARRNWALQSVAEAFDSSLPYEVHEAEGAFFLWLRFPQLGRTDRELYARLKERGVLTVPGAYFFPGRPHDCAPDAFLRVSYARPPAEVASGLGIIAEEILREYNTSGSA